jgi:hypothetical protein
LIDQAGNSPVESAILMSFRYFSNAMTDKAIANAEEL